MHSKNRSKADQRRDAEERSAERREARARAQALLVEYGFGPEPETVLSASGREVASFEHQLGHPPRPRRRR